jgi:four helix bundle protein
VVPEKGPLYEKSFAVGVKAMELVERLPKGMAFEVIGKQLLRSATSVGANYRAAIRPRSTADFIAKMSIAEEECDESLFWLELLGTKKELDPALLAPLKNEASEVLAMVVASIKTAKQRR